jgi:hypothetical protein
MDSNDAEWHDETQQHRPYQHHSVEAVEGLLSQEETVEKIEDQQR